MNISNDVVKPEKSLSKNILRGSKKYTKPEKGDFAQELEKLNDIAKTSNKIILYVILIMSVMVATMLLMVWNMVLDADTRKTESNSYLINQISILENKVDSIAIKKK